MNKRPGVHRHSILNQELIIILVLIVKDGMKLKLVDLGTILLERYEQKTWAHRHAISSIRIKMGRNLIQFSKKMCHQGMREFRG
jgi:hypothetical protein